MISGQQPQNKKLEQQKVISCSATQKKLINHEGNQYKHG